MNGTSGQVSPMARLVLLWLLAAALAVRVGWSLRLPADEAALAALPDQAGYIEMGRNILAGRGLVWRDERFGDDVYAIRTPGYPLFVAACGGRIMVVRLAQAVLDTSSVLAAFLLARRWLRPRQSLLAAALVAFNPFLIYFSSLALTETLFTTLLIWGILLLVAAPGFLPAAIVLAMSVLVRPSAIALPVILGIAASFVRGRRAEPRWTIPAGAMMVLVTGLALLPWAYRNSRVFGAWVWTTTNGGVTFFDGFNPQATGASDQSMLSDLEWSVRLRGLNELQRDQVLQEAGRQWISRTWREEPVRLAKLTAAKIARTWSPMPLSSDYSRPLYRAVGLIYTVPLYVLAVVGLWGKPAAVTAKGWERENRGGKSEIRNQNDELRKKAAESATPKSAIQNPRWRCLPISVVNPSATATPLPRSAKWLLLLPAVYFTMVHALSVGSLRYRVPAEVPLAVLAAAALTPIKDGQFRRVEAADAE